MPDPTIPLVLGSSSRYRRELLQRISSSFVCFSPNIDESPRAHEAPAELAARLANTKARTAGQEYPDSVVIGSDQVAVVADELLGKPGNATRAHAQLMRCSANTVTFYTAVALYRGTHELESHTDITRVRFRELNADEIQRYLEKEQPWDCAGSFKSEGLGVALFETIETNDPNALIGLPLIWLCGALKRAGLDPLGV